jgi:SPP1 gp7 family putative phage head morphogenesis protein
VGEDKDLGLFSNIAPIIMAKKFAIGSYSHYIEKFGIPFRWISTDSTDKARIKMLNEIGKKIAGAGYAVLNSTEKMEAFQPSQMGHQVFKDFISVCNDEISKAMVGQNGTTDHNNSKGTYGSLIVLQGVANDRHESDKMMVANNVNMELIPRLINNFEYPLTGFHFDWSKTEDLEVGLFIEAVKDLSLNYDIDIKQITEKTGINIIGRLQKPGPTPTAQKKNSRRYLINLPLSDHIVIDSHPLALDESALRNMEDDVLQSVFHGKQVFSPGYFQYLASELNTALEAGWKNIPMDYSSVDESVRTMMEASIYRFSAAKDLAMLQQLNELVRESSTFEDFKKKAATIVGTYDGDYLKTEYNNAIASGQNAARYRQQMEDIEDLPYWQYMTAGDDRVREAHRILDGLILKADDPAWSRIYPPNGWGCRCEVVALGDIPTGMKVVDGDYPISLLQKTGIDNNGLSEFDRMKRDGFAINRGELATVFTENENYIKQFDAKFSIDDMYGTKDMAWNNLDKSLLPSRIPTLKNDQAASDWYDSIKGDQDSATLSDEKGRGVTLTLDTFKRNPDLDIVEFLPTIISSPDEIWLNGKGGQQGITKTFVKFYDQDMIMIYVDVYADQPMTIKSYGQGNDKKRSGILIKRYSK